MEKFRDKYRIKSTRMPGWDYARGGKYYVTICTRNRICCFGDVIDGKMYYNEMGKIANGFWREIPKHFPDTWLDEYVVMPNHVHGIVVMKRSKSLDDVSLTNMNARNVETPKLGVSTFRTCPTNPTIYTNTKIPNWQPGALGVIINQFKRICTITFKNNGYCWYGWQPRFDDRIIRDTDALNRIRYYIRNNPANWDTDNKNPKNVKTH